MKNDLKSPEDVAQEWLKLKEKKILLEKRIDDLKPILEAFLLEQQDQEAEICGYRFKISVCERSIFELAKALKNKTLSKLLKPYIKEISYSQIRASFCGEEEIQEAA